MDTLYSKDTIVVIIYQINLAAAQAQGRARKHSSFWLVQSKCLSEDFCQMWLLGVEFKT